MMNDLSHQHSQIISKVLLSLLKLKLSLFDLVLRILL